jgi:hypothetical protein
VANAALQLKSNLLEVLLRVGKAAGSRKQKYVTVVVVCHAMVYSIVVFKCLRVSHRAEDVGDSRS